MKWYHLHLHSVYSKWPLSLLQSKPGVSNQLYHQMSCSILSWFDPTSKFREVSLVSENEEENPHIRFRRKKKKNLVILYLMSKLIFQTQNQKHFSSCYNNTILSKTFSKNETAIFIVVQQTNVTNHPNFEEKIIKFRQLTFQSHITSLFRR